MRARCAILVVASVLLVASGASAATTGGDTPLDGMDPLEAVLDHVPDPPAVPGPEPPDPEDPPGPLGDDGSLCDHSWFGESPPLRDTPAVSICNDWTNDTAPDSGGDPGGAVVTFDTSSAAPVATPTTGSRPGVDAGEVETSLVPSRSEAVQAASDTAPEWTLALATLALAALLPLLRLYRRIGDDEVLDHPTRRRLVDLLEEDPGMTAADAARSLDVAYDTVRYHLRRLHESEEVTTRRTDGKIRYFPNHGTYDRRSIDVLSVLASDVRRRIVRSIHDAEGLYAGEVAERVDIARSTASHHLDRLLEAGVLERDRHGNHIRYDVTPEARKAVRGHLAET